MRPLHLAPWILLIAVLCAAGTAEAQTYPARPIRLVTGSPGGATDFTARLIAQAIAAPLGQPIVVDNRGGSLPPEVVSQAAPDGYVLLYDGDSFMLGPLLEKMRYDPIRDFAPVTAAVSTPSVLVVHPSVGAASVKDLVAIARAKPGVLNYGSGPSGAAANLAAARTPASIVARLNQAAVDYLHTPAARQRMLDAGLEAVGSTPGEMSALMKANIAKWSKVIREAGIRSE